MSYRHIGRSGFTLVELLVVIVIISILAGLSLAGLAGVRRRSREEATRTTIRKIHEIIVPQYESYLDKRLSSAEITSEAIPTFAQRSDCYDDTASSPASSPLGRRILELRKLAAIRRVLAVEMPDNWNDVGSVSIPYQNGRTLAYASYASLTNNNVSPEIESAECLYMICMLSGFQPEVMENFRAEEIGNVDNDQRPEFLDAWGRPIAFIRWPTAFDGPITLNQDTDPFDPESIDPPPNQTPLPLPGVVPLIYSAGLDQEYGLEAASTTSGQSTLNIVCLGTITNYSPPPFLDGFGSPVSSGTVEQDNISNHDLITR